MNQYMNIELNKLVLDFLPDFYYYVLMNWISISSTTPDLEDFVTIAKKKTVNLSRGFLVKNNLSPQKNKFATFLFDTENNKLAIRISEKRTKDSFKISYSINNWGAKISCNRMFTSFKIDQKLNQGRYKYESINDPIEGKLYVLKLKPIKHGT